MLHVYFLKIKEKIGTAIIPKKGRLNKTEKIEQDFRSFQNFGSLKNSRVPALSVLCALIGTINKSSFSSP